MGKGMPKFHGQRKRTQVRSEFIALAPAGRSALSHLMGETQASTAMAPRPKGDTHITAGAIWLSVPFSRKDEVKRLGAFWSPEQRKWFIPRHITDYKPFIKAGFLHPVDKSGRI